jgi:hypothetical protein
MRALLLPSLAALVAAAANGGNGTGTEAHHGLFQMGGHLEYTPVAVTMAFIVVFTIFCEQCVGAMIRWVAYFNPLLQPCLDKVITELMILGATAFLILLTNEGTNYSLQNGDFMPTSWYYTLHWIDTTIFIFAVIFVLAACYVLCLCARLTNWLAEVDATDTRVVLDRAWRCNLDAHAHSEATKAHLTAHLELFTAGAPDDGAALALPAAAVEHLLSAARAGLPTSSLDLEACTNLHDVEQQLRVFLCAADSECILRLDSASRKFASRALHALVEYNVLKCYKDELATVAIRKSPSANWDFMGHAVASAELGAGGGGQLGWWARFRVTKNLQVGTVPVTLQVLLLYYYGTAMALLWHCYGTAITLLLHCYYTAVILLNLPGYHLACLPLPSFLSLCLCPPLLCPLVHSTSWSSATSSSGSSAPPTRPSISSSTSSSSSSSV